MKPMDFADLRVRLRVFIPRILEDILPRGKMKGNGYVAYNPHRLDKSLGSFRINIITGKWADFATRDRGGDIISLYAYVKGYSSKLQAAKELKELYLGGNNE